MRLRQGKVAVRFGGRRGTVMDFELNILPTMLAVYFI